MEVIIQIIGEKDEILLPTTDKCAAYSLYYFP